MSSNDHKNYKIILVKNIKIHKKHNLNLYHPFSCRLNFLLVYMEKHILSKEI